MRSGWIIIVVVAILVSASDADAARNKRRRRRVGKGVISVTSTVTGARVFLNGKLWGKTPLKPLRISPRSYTVKVVKLGYLGFEKQVVIRSGKRSRVSAPLLPVAGVLRVYSTQQSEVFVDGESQGKTPLSLELSVGPHRVRVVSDGAEDVRTVTAAAAEELVWKAFEPASEPSEGTEPALALAPPLPGDEPALVFPSTESIENEPPLVGLKPQDTGDEPALVAPSAEKPKADPELFPVLSPSPADRALGLDSHSVANRVDSKAWYERWWVWTAGGAVVLGAVATSYALSSGGSDDSGFVPDANFTTDGTDGIGPTLP